MSALAPTIAELICPDLRMLASAIERSATPPTFSPNWLDIPATALLARHYLLGIDGPESFAVAASIHVAAQLAVLALAGIA